MVRTIGIVTLAAAVFLGGCATPKGDSPSAKRTHIDDVARQTLEMAYKTRPALKTEIDRAAGYAVFSNVNVMVLFVGGGGGYGVVVDNEDDKRTYMQMGEGDLGFGLGAKDFRAVFVFTDRTAMRHFIYTGWNFGAEADAAAKSGDAGGAATAAGDIEKGVRVYQFTETGALASANLRGTKFWRDKDLNK